MQRNPDATKTTSACANCRTRKVRCNGTNPCSNCLRHSSQCIYPTSRRGKRAKHSQNSSPDDLSAGISQIRVIPYQPPQTSRSIRPTATSQSPARESVAPFTLSRPSHEEPQESSTITSPNHDLATATLEMSNSNALLSSYASSPWPPPQLPTFQGNQTAPQTSLDLNAERRHPEDNAVTAEKASGEHHGPWSWISVCSQAGIRWVCAETQNDDFVEMANELTRALSRRMRLKRDQVKPRRSEELDETTAWKYVNAYFENCYDRVFGIVHQPTFEARLRSHFANLGREQDDDEDAAWYALRNIVYAAGCRCVLGKCSSVSFVEAQAEAFRFFQNALSAFIELTFAYTGLTAVRALTLMSFYAEGIGCPALDYPLCANATQAALTKGLHREPSPSSGLQGSEIISRNWLWWTIYCLEKQLAFRTGRPSLIEDDNISTKIPTVPSTGTTMDIDAIRYLIKHAQISAQISSRIMSVKAFKQAPEETVNAMCDIDNQLRNLLDSLPSQLRIAYSPKKDFPETLPNIGAYYLHCAIHGSLMATHMSLFYPWMSLRFGKDTNREYQNRITSSAEKIAQAARQIILILPSVNTNAATPAWLSFYYPMYAHINLFVYTLKYPHNVLAQSDLALLDVSAGHFGCLEYITSSTIAFHFPRDSIALAGKIVRGTQAKMSIGSSANDRAGLAALGIETGGVNSPVRPASPDIEPTGLISTTLTEASWYPDVDLDMDVWNIFPGYDKDVSFDDIVI